MEMEANVEVAATPVHMLQSDFNLPIQEIESHRKQVPEKHLMIAVLQDALECVVKYRHAHDLLGRRLFEDAESWLLAEDTGWPYSFECICAVLDLEPDAVRQRMRLVPSRWSANLPQATVMAPRQSNPLAG